jgi:RND family efflux transporter MFP subunit
MKNRGKHLVAILLAMAAIVGGYVAFSQATDQQIREVDASTDAAAPVQTRRIPVAITPVAVHTFDDRLEVQGNIEAKTFAVVTARVPGTIEAFFVEEGDPVVAGETKLFQVDSLKLDKALIVREQDLAVARCASREKEANLERVQADFAKAEMDYKRFQRLYEKKVVAEDALEQQESRYKQIRASLKHARTLVALGKEQERQAEAAVAISEKDLSDSLVYAPISGRVSVRFKEVGELADVGAPAVRIEDASVIKVSAFLPEQYYPRVFPGKTRMRLSVFDADQGEYTVSYKSPTIHPKLRTFEIKCVLEKPPEGVVLGAMARLQIVLDQHTGPGVPAGAIQIRSGGPVVFVIENDVARMLPVEMGLESDGWVAVTADDLSEGAHVVTMGQYNIEDGTPVAVQPAGEGA